MAKIMLVEDDNNLREIYGARLEAEGYEIVAAKDGEEALALAVKEKPDLIISDVMMPRISGFDMLDILRNAPETQNTKVIMMTALSQAEDKARADKLGADRYLVKSQVTLEDVANVVREMLNEGEVSSTDEISELGLENAGPQPTVESIANPNIEVHDEPDPSQIQAPPVASEGPAAPTPIQAASPTNEALINDPQPAVQQPPASQPIVQQPVQQPTQINVTLPQDDMTSSQQPVQDDQTVQQPEETSVPNNFVGPSLEQALASEQSNSTGAQAAAPAATSSDLPSINNGAPAPVIVEPSQQPQPEVTPEEKPATVETNNNVAGMRVIQPINDPLATPDLNQLLEQEEQKAGIPSPSADTVISPQGQTSSDNPPQPPKNDQFNNIAL